MSKPPAFQFYPRDYLADANVDMMTLEQQGAYVRLLCHAWRSDTPGRLLNDRSTLAQLARMSKAQWEMNEAPILRAFRVDADGFITQKRMVKEWELMQERRQQAVEAGKASAKARRQRPLNDRSTTVQREGNTASASASASLLRESGACRPDLREVLEFASSIHCGLAEWKAKDWFLEMDGCGWLDHNHRPVSNWKAVLARVKAKWEADGRPAGPPARSKNNGAGQSFEPSLGQRKKAIEEEINRIPDDPNADERARLKKLRAALVAVNDQLTGIQ